MHSISHIVDQKFKIHPSKMFKETNITHETSHVKNDDIINRIKKAHFLHHRTLVLYHVRKTDHL